MLVFIRSAVLRWRLWLPGLVLLAAGGCPHPFFTRLPTVEPRHPLVERRTFERSDPYPDERLGPDTNARPPDFADQRPKPREDLETRIRVGPQTGFGPFAPRLPSNQWQYPHAVPH